MGWEWELRDLGGVTVGLMQPRSAKITRNLNAASTIEITVGDTTAPPDEATLLWFDPFDYEAGTIQAADPTRWRASVWGDPDAFATGAGQVQTNRADGSWAGASSVQAYGDLDLTVTVDTVPVTNGVLEVYALQSLDDLAMLAYGFNVALARLELYQVNAAGAYTLLAQDPYTAVDGDSLTLRVRGATAEGLVNGELRVSSTHSVPRGTGLVGFETNDAAIRLGSWAVRPTGAGVSAPDTTLDVSTARVAMGWRTPAGGGARVLRATGKTRTAMQLSVARDSLDELMVQATDAYGVLEDRLTDVQTIFTAATPRAIVVSLLASQNGRANTGAYMDQTDLTPAGPPRDRTYERGKGVAEAIKQLAEVDDGFYFRVDPYDGYELPIGWWYFSEIVLLHPAPGTDSAASFEFGEGTAANLVRVQVDIRPPVNSVMAFGAGSGDDQLVSIQSDAASIATYGLYDRSVSFSDIIVQGTLDQHALDLLRPSERRTFKVEVAAPTGNGELSIPSPWDDFDVGDTVQLNIRTRALEYTGRALVKSFTVTVDANGVERLSSIDFQED